LDGDEHANFYRILARRRHAFSGIFVVNPLKLGVGGDLPKIRNLNQKMCSKGPKNPFFGSHLLSAFLGNGGPKIEIKKKSNSIYTRVSSRVPASAGTRNAVPWGVRGLACGMPEPVFCVVKYFHELNFSGGPWFLVVFHRVCEALLGAVVTVVC
jgi:hypothetical protein